MSEINSELGSKPEVSSGSNLKTWLSLAAFVLVSLFFYLFPEVDLWAAHLFYDRDQRFYLNETQLVQITYDMFRDLPKLLIPIMLAFLFMSIKSTYCKIHRHLCLFALVTLLLGPGIIVHNIFKDHWDRARPRHVVEFGGDKQFSSAWVISDQCERNCSFVSGHAAMGFYAMILGWLLGSRCWFFIGLSIGALVGLVRVVQGGHFLSDSILAGFIVYWTIWLVAKWMRVPNPGDEWQCPEVQKQKALAAQQDQEESEKADNS